MDNETLLNDLIELLSREDLYSPDLLYRVIDNNRVELVRKYGTDRKDLKGILEMSEGTKERDCLFASTESEIREGLENPSDFGNAFGNLDHAISRDTIVVYRRDQLPNYREYSAVHGMREATKIFGCEITKRCFINPEKKLEALVAIVEVV